jgi:hypothetical protein
VATSAEFDAPQLLKCPGKSHGLKKREGEGKFTLPSAFFCRNCTQQVAKLSAQARLASVRYCSHCKTDASGRGGGKAAHFCCQGCYNEHHHKDDGEEEQKQGTTTTTTTF